MFKQLSQISKNLTDELAKGLNEDFNDIHESQDNSSTLPKEIQGKLKKFEKYEQKYPLLLNAYKNEKLKNEKLDFLNKVIAENTPISSLDDIELLSSFFKDLNLKTNMLHDEIKRLTSDKFTQQKEMEELSKQLIQKTEVPKNEAVELLQNLDYTKQKLSEKEIEIENLTTSHDKALEDLKISQSKQMEVKEKEIGNLTIELENLKLQLEAITKKEKIYEDNHMEDIKQLESLKNELQQKEKVIMHFKENFKGLTDFEASTEVNKGQNMLFNNIPKSVNSKRKKGKKQAQRKVMKEIELPETEYKYDPVSLIETSIKYEQLLNEVDELKKSSINAMEWKEKYDNLIKNGDELENKEKKIQELTKNLDLIETSYAQIEKKSIETKELLLARTEELDTVKDMLKTVGNELVDAKNKIKESDEVDKQAQSEANTLKTKYETTELELNAKILDLSSENDKLENKLTCLVKDNSVLEENKMVLETELKKSQIQITKYKQSNNKLNDQLKDLDTLKKSESSMKGLINQHQKDIEHLKKQIDEYVSNESKVQNESNIIRQENEILTKRINHLIKDNEKLKNDMKKNDSTLENYIKENGKLSERLDVCREKYEMLQDLKTNNNDHIDSIKRQCRELDAKLKEANKKIFSLEDELNENANLVQERTNEVTSMRRLLNENQTEKILEWKKLEDKLIIISEEKSNVESKLDIQLSRKNREVQELKDLISELKSQLHDFTIREKELYSECEELRLANQNIKKKSSVSIESSDEFDQTLSGLREALAKSETKVREFQDINAELKDLNNNLNKKFERLSKNYKTISSLLKSKQEYPNTSNSSNHMAVANSENVQTYHFTQPVQESHTLVGKSESDLNEKIAYIKNVLLGFLEHKDQRSQLLPVVSMLLHLDSNDEKRLLMFVK